MGDMEQMVIDVISSPEAYKLRTFTFAGKTFTSGVFYNIKSMIEGGFIKVVYEEKRSGSAEYDIKQQYVVSGISENVRSGPKSACCARSVVRIL